MKSLKLLVLTLAVTAIPSLAEAGSLTDKAYQIAALLGSREATLTPGQQASVARDLDSILNTLSNQPQPQRGYLCVSRDNDNNRPYVIAYKDFANVVRVPGAAYGSKADCEQSLAAAQRYNDRLFLCATRDNDGSRPWKLVMIANSPNATILQRSILGSLDECLAASRAMQLRPEGVLYCGSRDNDGSRPFAQTGMRHDGSFVPSRDEYDTLQSCNDAL